jgi:hypothetical protein
LNGTGHKGWKQLEEERKAREIRKKFYSIGFCLLLLLCILDMCKSCTNDIEASENKTLQCINNKIAPRLYEEPNVIRCHTMINADNIYSLCRCNENYYIRTDTGNVILEVKQEIINKYKRFLK